MPQIEERTARIEGILEQMSERIGALEGRISSLEGRMSTLETRMDGLSSQIQDNFRWTMAIMIGSWVTIVGIMITLFTTMR